jgi:SAM-dependent methyltransferase
MARPGRGRLLVYDVLEQSLLGQYDAVFLLDVIEHVSDDVAFVQAASRHLRPGGLVIINVPAHRRLASDYDRIAGHLRRYSRRRMANLLRLCGIQPGAIWQWGLSMVPLLVARKALLASNRSNSSETALRHGFVPPTRTANLLLHALKNLETILPFPMPLGSSILAWGTVSCFSHKD